MPTMSATKLPDTGDVGFYVQRVWPLGGHVARGAVIVGLVMVAVSAWLVREELEESDPAKALALAGVATAVAGIVSGKVAKDVAERVTKALAAAIGVGAVLYAAGVTQDTGLAHNQFVAVMLIAAALHLVMYGAAALNFRSNVEEGGGLVRSWAQAAAHPERPKLPSSRIGVWEILTAPLLIVTFRGIFIIDLPRPGLYVLWFVALYMLFFLTSIVYLEVPRSILTPMVMKDEVQRHLRRHGVVAARALPLRIGWKREGTWRRASLPRSGPYRLTALRRVCRRLDVPEPDNELQLRRYAELAPVGPTDQRRLPV
jgi:hypothetical protein